MDSLGEGVSSSSVDTTPPQQHALWITSVRC